MSKRRRLAYPDTLYPFVCCDCRRSFKRPSNEGLLPRPCPLCGQPAAWVNRKFKAPKATDVAQWEKVRLLIEHGFLFHSFGVRYPETLEEARTWVKQWSANAIRVVT
jgi:hypothetical protein